jgi:hypothetical protein
MTQNLLQTGTVFDYATDDYSYADDILDLDIADDTIEVSDSESDMCFEDEK